MSAIFTRKTLATVALVAAVVLAGPAVASALPQMMRPAGSSSTTAQANQAIVTENLRNRIENVIRAREARFRAAEALLSKKQTRLELLASKVESLGADVSAVRARIEESRQLLEQAREQEQTAIQAMRGVPDATDRRGAFRQARLQAREAVLTLKQSRVALREAARELRQIALALKEDADE
ncbi:hypothetical protein MX659_07990 [Coriobacteriia bacterium Es71-Z0120]|uniref:hypothetical protein n=1 Tax=Parvivirga hydrogeniphila TaxID=2939460 RepID=UPI002260A495|nr:hypothetical protein [Parvivirga hydrogeniphila]MCL4079520.1 hypothetical protein [Parvivirga hydrogeniphila]